jgi:membrane-associated protease RseP (regulator of RpoE activity)
MLALLVLASPLIVHELGHWAVLKGLGCPKTRWHIGMGPALLKFRSFQLGLFPLGMAVEPDAEFYDALSPGKKLSVASAGPAMSLAYAAVILIWAQLGTADRASGLLAAMSVSIALVNLLPLPPLDGFFMVQYYYEKKEKPLSPAFLHLTHRIGQGALYGIGFWILAQWLL